MTAPRNLAAACAAAALALACAHPARKPPAAEEPGVEVGLASYYARMHEGHATASGVPYHGGLMTCAHRSYPFGAVLRVTDLDSGRSVEVRVIDRGPFAPGRVVDLSRAAARALGILERGVARVRVERVK